MTDLEFFIEDFCTLAEFTGRRLGLNEKDKNVLACFVEYPGISSYRIYRDPKKFLGKYVSERAVRRSVNQLANKGLIGDDKKNYCLIQKKGKKLSIGGIYYLILDLGMQLHCLFRIVLTNYGENTLFQLFLYPYLDKSTIVAIQDYNLLSRIYSYLYECCVDIENIFFMSDKSGYITQEIFIWQDVPDNKTETRRLFNFLGARFKLPWLEGSEIAKFDDNRSLWIRHGANYISIKLKSYKKAVMKIRDQQKIQEYELMTRGYTDYVSKNKNKASMKRPGRKKEQEYELKKYNPDFLSVRMPIMSVRENAAHYLLLSTQQHVPSFIFDLAFKAIPGSTDYEVLSHDEKFLQALRKTKRKFDIKYKILTSPS